MQTSESARQVGISQDRPSVEATVATCFHMECSACGRQLRVHVEHLGRPVACAHCGNRFVATEQTANGRAALSAMQRAEQLLARYACIRLA